MPLFVTVSVSMSVDESVNSFVFVARLFVGSDTLSLRTSGPIVAHHDCCGDT